MRPLIMIGSIALIAIGCWLNATSGNASANTKPTQVCTMAYGQCAVTVYRYHLRNGTIGIWTCYATPPIKPGASNIWLGTSECYRP